MTAACQLFPNFIVLARERAARRLSAMLWPMALAGLLLLASAQAQVRADDSWVSEMEAFQSLAHSAPTRKFRTRAEREEARRRANAALDAALRPTIPLLSRESEEALQVAIRRYQRITAAGGWPKMPKGRRIKPGESDERVITLRRRLLISGDLKGPVPRSWTLDRRVVEAVKRFQIRHGIGPTGMVDRATIAALNVPADVRLAQLRLNLARLRAFTEKKLGRRHVVVNIPAFDLQAVENGEVVLHSRVIVGRKEPGRQTPTLSAKIRGLNFYPFWRVPDSIANRDLIPQLIKDPSYLEKERIRVIRTWGGEEIDPSTINWRTARPFPYKFRQDPGKFNALGVVRIDMPNPHTVYLHDTPMKSLFTRYSRAYSAGCVRVRKVLDLAAWLLKEQDGWNRARIDSIIASGVSENVKLKEPVPVYFVYVTAWARADGSVHFRDDIYRRDGIGGLVASYQARSGDESEAQPVQSIAP